MKERRSPHSAPEAYKEIRDHISSTLFDSIFTVKDWISTLSYFEAHSRKIQREQLSQTIPDAVVYKVILKNSDVYILLLFRDHGDTDKTTPCSDLIIQIPSHKGGLTVIRADNEQVVELIPKIRSRFITRLDLAQLIVDKHLHTNWTNEQDINI